MPNILPYFFSGICLVGFLAIWFSTARKELYEKRTGLAGLEEQLHLHERLAAEASGGPDAHSADGMLEISRMLFFEASKSYNNVLTKPSNRVPALLMGFRAVEENIQGKKEGTR